MSNYWDTLRHRKISRRTMLGASAKAGVGAAGIALVGCGDDDDDGAATLDTAAVDAAASDAAAAASAASDAAEAAGRAADAAESASALAADAAASEDAEQAAAAAQAAADAAADAAAAAEAAGDAGAAAVAQAAADAAEAAAQAAREAGAEDTAAGAAAAQAAADAAAAAAQAAQDASAAAAQAAELAAEAVAAVEEDDMAEDDMPAAGAVDLDATLRLGVNRDGGGLDPQRSGSHANYFPKAAHSDQAMTNDPNTSALQSHLVSSFETPDEETYILNITQGVPYHDPAYGEYTAHDTQFTYRRAGGIAEYHQGGETSDHPSGWATARASFGPPAAWASDEVIDDYTLRLDVGRPSASLPGSVFSAAVYHQSKAWVEEHGDEVIDTTVMSTGPWKFVSHTDDTDFVGERFEEYFKSRPGETKRALSYDDAPGTHLPWTKTLHGIIRPELLSMIAGVEADEIDVAMQLATDLVEPFLDDEDFWVGYSTAGAGTAHMLMPNQHLAEWDGAPNPFLDIRVREAANYAIDRDAYINSLLSGVETEFFGMFPGVFGYPSQDVWDSMARGYDPEKAKALMAEAGYPDGFDTTLHLVTDWVPVIPLLSLVIQQNLAEVGIRTTIKEYPSSEYFVEIRKFEQPGLWWFFVNTIVEPETVIGSTIAQGFYHVSPLPDSRIGELYPAAGGDAEPDGAQRGAGGALHRGVPAGPDGLSAQLDRGGARAQQHQLADRPGGGLQRARHVPRTGAPHLGATRGKRTACAARARRASRAAAAPTGPGR